VQAIETFFVVVANIKFHIFVILNYLVKNKIDVKWNPFWNKMQTLKHKTFCIFCGTLLSFAIFVAKDIFDVISKKQCLLFPSALIFWLRDPFWIHSYFF